eukprot:TRINITY_DN16356_c0_g1_i2.p1 TRINITY_DN16356_c0_g1~~TRINITY_DN16356_c0_g1_i2.p1  ORF type:complete len:380 (+),score=88.88 TRINITY_DN16356_c0_g1_i2:177-1316(+)
MNAWASLPAEQAFANGCTSPSKASCWDLSQAPVFLAGEDGQVHETRPTASLARDMAEAEARGEAEAKPVPRSSTGSRRSADPDERPLRPAGGYASPTASGGGATAASSSSSRQAAVPPRGSVSGGGGSSSSSARVSMADRPLLGSSPGWTSPKQRTSTAGLSPSPSDRAGAAAAARRRSSDGAVPSSMSWSEVKASRRNSTGGDTSALSSSSAAAAMQKRGSASGASRGGGVYAPIDVLLNMGYDEDVARVAFAAAGGDVDAAVRIMLEDARAHSAHRTCEWEFEGDSGWAPFDLETEEKLRKAVAPRGEGAVEIFGAGGRHYLVDFDSMTQVNLATKRTRRIRRRADAGGASSSSASSAACPAQDAQLRAHERAVPRR